MSERSAGGPFTLDAGVTRKMDSSLFDSARLWAMGICSYDEIGNAACSYILLLKTKLNFCMAGGGMKYAVISETGVVFLAGQPRTPDMVSCGSGASHHRCHCFQPSKASPNRQQSRRIYHY
jgi:hypothetical protein